MTIKYEDRKSRGSYTAREAATIVGASERTAQRWTSLPRSVWLQRKADEREKIRAYHDDENHSWTETAKHFGLSVPTVKERGLRARRERAQEQLDREQPPLPLDL